MGKGPEESNPEATLEVDRYTSPSQFEAERRVLFRKRPIIVGRVSELAIAASIQSGLNAGAQQTFHLGTLEHPIRVCHDAIDEAIAEETVLFATTPRAADARRRRAALSSRPGAAPESTMLELRGRARSRRHALSALPAQEHHRGRGGRRATG